MTATLESKLTKSQKKRFGPVFYTEHGKPCAIVAEVRHDDDCGNGHNTFSITADLYESYPHLGEPTIKTPEGKTLWMCGGGCCHDEVAKHFPELAPLIKWHLCGTDGPMHYLANALYQAGHKGWRDGKPGSPPNLEYLKSTIAYGALQSDDQFDLAAFLYREGEKPQYNENAADILGAWLIQRREALLEAFKRDVESLGFVY